ncbi:ZapG family protein, partial [Citrobacter braakii]|uniref:ZapG family protein n=1 Tax=Citrobacter braakii TaxID=57706 RepID=UPI0030D15B86
AELLDTMAHDYRQLYQHMAKSSSSLLPELVNKLTPDGQAPQGDLDIGSLLARFS